MFRLKACPNNHLFSNLRSRKDQSNHKFCTSSETALYNILEVRRTQNLQQEIRRDETESTRPCLLLRTQYEKVNRMYSVSSFKHSQRSVGLFPLSKWAFELHDGWPFLILRDRRSIAQPNALVNAGSGMKASAKVCVYRHIVVRARQQ